MCISETGCSSNTGSLVRELQAQEISVLSARVATLEKELCQSRKETERFSGIVTELRAGCEDAAVQVVAALSDVQLQWTFGEQWGEATSEKLQHCLNTLLNCCVKGTVSCPATSPSGSWVGRLKKRVSSSLSSITKASQSVLFLDP